MFTVLINTFRKCLGCSIGYINCINLLLKQTVFLKYLTITTPKPLILLLNYIALFLVVCFPCSETLKIEELEIVYIQCLQIFGIIKFGQ